VLELRVGDEIVAVDGADVAHHYLESVQSVIGQAVSRSAGTADSTTRLAQLVTFLVVEVVQCYSRYPRHGPPRWALKRYELILRDEKAS